MCSKSRVRRAFEPDFFVRRAKRWIQGVRIAPLDAVVCSNVSSDDDSTIKSRTVQQRFEYLLCKQIFEVNAGHIQPAAVENTLANTEVLAHEMAERHTTRGQVSPMLMGSKLDAPVARERVQDFTFDQRGLTVDVMVLRVSPESRRIAIAFYPGAGDQSRFEERFHGRRSFRGDMNVQQFPLPMHVSIIVPGPRRGRENQFSKTLGVNWGTPGTPRSKLG